MRAKIGTEIVNNRNIANNVALLFFDIFKFFYSPLKFVEQFLCTSANKPHSPIVRKTTLTMRSWQALQADHQRQDAVGSRLFF